MLTRAEENYLKTIFHLEKETSEEVSTKAIAEKIQTKPSSVTDMVQKIAEKNYLYISDIKGFCLQSSAENLLPMSFENTDYGKCSWLKNSTFSGMKFTKSQNKWSTFSRMSSLNDWMIF